MKKFVIFLFLYSSTQILWSQENYFFQKNTILTGGTFSFDLQKANYPNNVPNYHINSTNFGSDFYLGYYLFNHFAFGLKTNISTYKEKLVIETDVHKSTYSVSSVGPFIRYSTKYKLFFEGGAEFGSVKYSNTKRESFSFNVGIGYSLFLSNSVAFEPKIKYNYYHLPEKNTMDEEVRNDLIFSLGLQIYLDLNRKK